jgi:hypothetical protein
MVSGQSRSRLIRVATTAALIIGVTAVVAAASAGRFGGGTSATYSWIATPTAVSEADRGIASVIAKSQNAVTLQGRQHSKTMIEDASGRRFGGGESNRETEYDVALLMGRPPGFALLNAYGWGKPGGPYRLDATLTSPLVSVSRPISGAAMDPAIVSKDRKRLAAVYSDVFSAIGVSGQWEAASLARDSVIKRYYDGPDMTIVGALLPPRSSTEQTGSLVVLISGGWALESVYVETTDSSFYQNVVNDRF